MANSPEDQPGLAAGIMATSYIPSCKAAVMALAAAFAFVVIFVSIMAGAGLRTFNFDTWAFYELSSTIFRDFYRISTYRTYFTIGDYGASYPPLYPIAIAVVDAVTGLRWWSGLLVNVAATFVMSWVSARASQRLVGMRSPGLLAALALLAFLPFINEIAGARSHPLALMLLALTVLVLVHGEKLGVRHGLFLGIIGAFGYLDRFDWELPIGVIGLLLVFWTRRPLVVLAYAASVVIVLLPWMAYCVLHFGVPLASDSNWIAMALHGGYNSTDYVQQTPAPIRGPGDLINKLIENWGAMSEIGRDAARHTAPLVAVLGLIVGLHLVMSGQRPKLVSVRLTPAWRRLLTLLAVWPTILIAIWMTDYASIRYLSGLVWQLLFIVLCLAGAAHRGAGTGQWRRLCLIAAVIFGAYGCVLAVYLDKSGTGTQLPLIHHRNQALVACLQSVGGEPSQTVLFDNDEQFSVEFGAIEHWRAAVPPKNLARLDRESVLGLLSRFRVKYIVGPTKANLTAFMGQPVSGCPDAVHRVVLPQWKGSDQ